MNRHTFADAVGGRRNALSNELGDDEGSDEEETAAGGVPRLSKAIDGEEGIAKGVKTYEMGVEIEAFNLNDEREEGHFDATGNFVFAKGKKEEDAWISSMNEAEMEKGIGEAIEAKKRRDSDLQKRAAVVAKNEQASPAALKERILALGTSHETVAEALQRLSSGNGAGGNGSRGLGFTKRGREREPAPLSSPFSRGGASDGHKRQLLELIDLSDQLLSKGLTSIYNMTFAAIKNSLTSWEYRSEDGTVYGPYSCADIATWKAMGYFTGASAVEIRPVRECEVRPGGNPKKRQVSFVEGGSAKKRARTDTSPSADTDDLVRDLDDSDDDDEGKKDETHVWTGGAASVDSGEEWVSSDSVDFGPPPDTG
jgi:CD2 antigen cytoplasmic tail-binding protein 2